MKLDIAKQENLIQNNNVDYLVKSITCSDENKSCMYRERSDCKDKEVSANHENEGKQVKWSMWNNRRVERVSKIEGIHKIKKMTEKETEQGTLQTLAIGINKELNRFTRQFFIFDTSTRCCVTCEKISIMKKL